MMLCAHGAARALALALLILGACVDHSPILDSRVSLSGFDFIDLGAPPSTVVVADFDGDGRPDLAAASGVANGVIVTLGRHDGFTPPRVYPAGHACQLVAGDFDRDGKVDLAVTNEAGVGVLLGKGDGTFGAVRSFDAGASPDAIVLGDFNRDGKLDLAVTNDAGISVLLGRGDGSFDPPSSYTVHAAPSGISRIELVTGDVDGDGTLDFVVATYPGRITTLFGNGDGTFRTGTVQEEAGERRIQAIAGGDFDDDGKLDLAVVSDLNEPGHPLSVSIWRGNGDGTFRGTGTTGRFDHGFHHDAPVIMVADLNGDGKLDVVASITHSSIVVTALGKGDGTLGVPWYYRISGRLVAVADIDGDGKPDVLTTRDRGVALFAGNGDGALRAPRSFQLGEDEGVLTGTVAVGSASSIRTRWSRGWGRTSRTAPLRCPARRRGRGAARPGPWP